MSAFNMINARRGTHLPTRDGRQIGNAVVLYVSYQEKHWMSEPVGVHLVFVIKTDFGNVVKMSLRELNELFYFDNRMHDVQGQLDDQRNLLRRLKNI